MVPGRTDQTRPLMILDLDGTVLSVNSFQVWALFMARARFPHLSRTRRARIGAAAVGALVRRKLGFSTHIGLKCRMQMLWQAAIHGDDGASERRLIAELNAFIRPELSDTLNAIAQGEIDGVLATAAAGDYAYAFGRSLGFTHVLATSPNRTPADPDNIGESKLNAVLSLLVNQSWQHRPRVLFTDHSDDLPLIRACETVYWFGTPEETLKVEQAAPEVRLCRDYNPERIFLATA